MLIDCLRDLLGRVRPPINQPQWSWPISDISLPFAVPYASAWARTAIGQLVPLLDDSNGRVRRAVVRMLANNDLHPWLSQIQETIEGGSPGGQAQALQLVSVRGGWEAVPDLLRGLRAESRGVRERAWRYLTAWYSYYRRRGWLRPSKPVRAALMEQLRRLEAVLATPPLWATQACNELKKWIEMETRSGTTETGSIQ